MSRAIKIIFVSFVAIANGVMPFQRSCSYAQEKRFPEENDIFVMGMADLDQMDKCGVNVLGWFGSLERPEQREWMGRCMDFARRHQMPAIMSLSIFDASWETYQRRPELAAACCKDIEGNRVIVNWETQSPDRPMYWGCTNHPTYRQFWIDVAKSNVDLGAQGIIADEMQGTSAVIWHDGGCYCEKCEEGFREFLRGHYDTEALNKLGVGNIDAFSFRDFVRKNASPKREELKKLVQRGKVPLMGEYERYQRLASRDYLERLVRETKSYAQEKYGRAITFSANTYDLAPATLYYLDLLDYFTVETPYVWRYQYPPHRRVLPYLRVAQALGKPAIALLDIYSGSKFTQRGGLPNLQRLHIAEAYASGNNTFLPDGVYAWSKESGPGRYVGDLDVMAPVCRFIRGSDFYTGSRPWGQRIALLYLTRSALKDSWRYWNSFTGTCWLLDDAHLPFDVVVSGDGELVKQKLDPAALKRYPVILLTGGAQPSDDEAVAILESIQAGGRVIWIGGDQRHPLVAAGAETTEDVGMERFEKEQPDAAVGVLEGIEEAAGNMFEFSGSSRCAVLPRILQDGTAVVHLVNFDYEVDADSFRPAQQGLLRLQRGGAFRELKGAFLTPDTGARDLTVRDQGGWLEVDVPEVEAYAVVLIGEQPRIEEMMKKTEHAVFPPALRSSKMKINGKASEWADVPSSLPHGIKVFLDSDGLYLYAPADGPRPFRSALFEIDLDGDGNPDLGYYADPWGGAVSKYGAENIYLGRARAARCESGMEFKIPGSALPQLRDLHVQMTMWNGEKEQTGWAAVGRPISAK